MLLSFFSVACSGDSPNEARVIDGKIDLSGWSASQDGLLALDGAWRFCRDKLIPPERLLDGRAEDLCPETGAVPDQWEVSKPLAEGSIGVATYLLSVRGIRLSDALPLSLGVDSVATAYRLYLVQAGQVRLILSRGVVGDSAQSTVPEFGFSYADMGELSDDDIHLVWQISNFHHHRSGPRRALRIGLLEDLRWQESAKTHAAFFVFGLLAIMGLYQLLTFTLHRAFRGGLWLAVLCFAILLRHLASEGYIGGNIDSNLTRIFMIRMKLEYIAFCVAVPSFVSFMHQLFPYRRPELVQKVVWGFSSFYVALILVTGPIIYGQFLPIYQLFSLGVIVWIGGYIAHAARTGNRWALSSFLGFVVLAFGTIADMASSAGFIDWPALSMYGLALFILTQAFVLAGLFSEAHKTAERLTGHLAEEVDKKTEALRGETERAREQQALAEGAKAEVERLDREKTAFFQNLSHDFRTPLTLILNVFGKLDQELPDHRAVAMGTRNTKRLARLVDELLDFQKIEDGSWTLEKQPVSVCAVIKKVTSYFGDSLEQRGLDFSCEWPEAWNSGSAGRTRAKVFSFFKPLVSTMVTIDACTSFSFITSRSSFSIVTMPGGRLAQRNKNTRGHPRGGALQRSPRGLAPK